MGASRVHLLLELGSICKLLWREHPTDLQDDLEAFFSKLVPQGRNLLDLRGQIALLHPSGGKDLIGDLFLGCAQLAKKVPESRTMVGYDLMYLGLLVGCEVCSSQ